MSTTFPRGSAEANQGATRIVPSADAALDGDRDALRVRALERLGALGAGRNDRLDRITRLAKQAFGVDNAALTLVDAREWRVRSDAVGTVDPLPREQTFCNVAVDTARPLIVPDALADQRFANLDPVTGAPHIRFYAGLPITDANDIPIGAFCITDSTPRDIGERELDMLVEFAELARSELIDFAEVHRARDMQQSLLPRHIPELKDYRLSGICIPTSSVGGDFFDWGVVDDGLCVSVSDVMGKGTAAAIMSATMRSAARAASARRAGRTRGDEGGDIAAVMREIAMTLAGDLDRTGTMITAFFGYLSLSSHHLRWADAGHGLALVARADGTIHWLVGTDLPFGVLADADWQEHRWTMAPDDRLLIFSDGLLDLLGGDRHALDEIAHLASEVADPDALVQQIRALADLGLAVDDVTAIVLRRLPAAP